jgi:hypothetical protein
VKRFVVPARATVPASSARIGVRSDRSLVHASFICVRCCVHYASIRSWRVGERTRSSWPAPPLQRRLWNELPPKLDRSDRQHRSRGSRPRRVNLVRRLCAGQGAKTRPPRPSGTASTCARWLKTTEP